MYTIELPFYPYSHHLDQLYTGIELLRKKNVVRVIYNKNFQPYNKINIVKARINNRYDVIYDLFDSANWLLGADKDENIKYYKNYLQSDFYFKRSYNNEFSDIISNYTNVFPFGFNYPVNIKHILKHKIINELKELIDYPFFHKYINFNTHSIAPHEFEKYPVKYPENKIIFLVRLWDPNGVADEIESKEISEDREQINLSRVNYIKACKKEFGNVFLGGVQDIPFSRKYCPELIMPRNLTNRRTYLKTMQLSNICVATTGLHGSTGWKFAEYIAASRAIVTEPLNFEVPGIFREDKNYLKFEKEDELIKNIYFLLNNPEKMKEMMFENYYYYNSYLRPDILVLNSLMHLVD